ncbi:Zn-dependent protease [Cyanobacterium sp. HL-69]|uniref:M48 family metallopeptidase n=1 Tax=unclassified Cyanobacterium TaxID=2629879 RepID=UPI0008692508|nr:M48 family metallopeptidase [Cyanobacterium sp. IPPAS B-1200]AUC61388.1 Zn-dependent protease [Cyanobacterium sp. HL-69]OEJ78967.1 peptidase [Cyanobacterium sp. IPPAS B-1200]
MKRRFFHIILSITVALTVIFNNVTVSYALPWGELFLRGIQVIQISNISDTQEVEYGRQMRQQLINSGRVKVYRNQNVNRYVNDIGQQLVKRSDRPNLPYTFTVVDNDQINAFATMGGFVYINTGLIRTASNEAELASVIGHEIGHVVAKHSQKQIRQQAVTQGLLSAAGLGNAQIVQLGVAAAVSLPNSRQDELEADTLGLRIITETGYAPRAMPDFMQKLDRGGRANILSTHPGAGERVVALNQQIPSNSANQGMGLNQGEYRNNIRPLTLR